MMAVVLTTMAIVLTTMAVVLTSMAVGLTTMAVVLTKNTCRSWSHGEEVGWDFGLPVVIRVNLSLCGGGLGGFAPRGARPRAGGTFWNREAISGGNIDGMTFR